jgi:hypothetical protein
MTSEPTDVHAEPVIVASYTDTGEAEVAQAKLRAYGIEAVIVDSIEGGALVTEEGGIGVEVRAADADDARAILADVPDDEHGVPI